MSTKEKDLGQEIVDFLESKNDFNEHIIDEILKSSMKGEILAAIEELSISDIVRFPNNEPQSAFHAEGEEIAVQEINYPVRAQLIQD